MGGWKVGGRICLMPFLCFLVATLLVVSSSTFYYTTKTTDTMMMSRRTRPPSPSSLQEALSHDEKGAAPRRRRASETTPKLEIETSGSDNFIAVDGTSSAQGAVLDGVFLNRLVNASVEATNSQGANIAFMKTHKTASTTFAGILYRFAGRHRLKLAHFGKESDGKATTDLKQAAKTTRETGGVVDIMHYHITAFGNYRGTWSEAKNAYRDIMRDPDNVNFMTVLRDPRAHLISYYYYYIQPANQLSIEEYLLHPKHGRVNRLRLSNLQLAEFGVRSNRALVDLIKTHFRDFKLIILTERFDEGLLLLRHLLGWSLVDITYVRMNKARKGMKRYDGKRLAKEPHYDDLPKQVQDTIDAMTRKDRIFYDAAKGHFEARLAPYSGVVQAERDQFKELQSAVSEYLAYNTSSKANNMYRKMSYPYLKPPRVYPF